LEFKGHVNAARVNNVIFTS